VIVATGRLHGYGLQPEKSMRALEADALMESYRINAIGPALIAKHVLPKLPRDRKSVFAALSARVSSISDNRSGGWHAYRASKAALNMLIRNDAIELAVRNPKAVCVTLHPGTVDTDMSKPFQSHVPNEKLFSPDISARHLLGVINDLTPEQTGRLIAWDGRIIDY
jgi:NAD(P)-dependent dehydrogenase (short-subunit alcohol dehydrogenase family)